jgi:hypothetical protein
MLRAAKLFRLSSIRVSMSHRTIHYQEKRVCIYYQRGHCRHGDYCRFLHKAALDVEGVLPVHHRELVRAENVRKRRLY